MTRSFVLGVNAVAVGWFLVVVGVVVVIVFPIDIQFHFQQYFPFCFVILISSPSPPPHDPILLHALLIAKVFFLFLHFFIFLFYLHFFLLYFVFHTKRQPKKQSFYRNVLNIFSYIKTHPILPRSILHTQPLGKTVLHNTIHRNQII